MNHMTKVDVLSQCVMSKVKRKKTAKSFLPMVRSILRWRSSATIEVQNLLLEGFCNKDLLQ